jgi:hypothetical protein
MKHKKFRLGTTVKKSQKGYRSALKHSRADYKSVRKKLGDI